MGRQTFNCEASSKTYSQPIFSIAQLAAEMRYSVLCGIMYYLLYYFHQVQVFVVLGWDDRFPRSSIPSYLFSST
ncbi:hypothetical protein BS47DRAFT_1341867 [Hydnum rufescens UP504]|uniref:Uncharacterized protein n=1 Tax=Hydnum rufescens UP504 TaxID=1448309 RepID=A0A9P6DYB7_9AGAM|nr:hypothetical protein BS47DRAFT_1341867 [Hydnum rufescens UP504]